MKEYYQIIRKARVVRPVGELEDKLLPPRCIFVGNRNDKNLQRLVKINDIRKLEDIEVQQLDLLNKPDNIIVLD